MGKVEEHMLTAFPEMDFFSPICKFTLNKWNVEVNGLKHFMNSPLNYLPQALQKNFKILNFNILAWPS